MPLLSKNQPLFTTPSVWLPQKQHDRDVYNRRWWDYHLDCGVKNKRDNNGNMIENTNPMKSQCCILAKADVYKNMEFHMLHSILPKMVTLRNTGGRLWWRTCIYKIDPAIANTQWLTDRPFDLTSCQTAHYLRRVTGGWLLTRTSWAAEDTLPDLNSVALYGPQCKVHIKLQVQSNVTGLLHVRTSTPQSCKIRQSHAGASRLSGSCPDSAGVLTVPDSNLGKLSVPAARLRLCKNPSHTQRLVFDQALKLDTYMSVNLFLHAPGSCTLSRQSSRTKF